MTQKGQLHRSINEFEKDWDYSKFSKVREAIKSNGSYGHIADLVWEARATQILGQQTAD